MASRWTNLPYSEYEQIYMAQTTATLAIIGFISYSKFFSGKSKQLSVLEKVVPKEQQTYLTYKNMRSMAWMKKSIPNISVSFSKVHIVLSFFFFSTGKIRIRQFCDYQKKKKQ